MVKEQWTDAEILALWPQAAGELRIFRRVLERNAGITASQLGMALHLAAARFEALQANADQILALDCDQAKFLITTLHQSGQLNLEPATKLEHHVTICEMCRKLCMTDDGQWACRRPKCHHPTFAAAQHCMACYVPVES